MANKNSLKIIEIKKPEQIGKVKKEISEILPNIYKGQLICLVAPIRSGKSNLWNWLMLHDNCYNDLFDSVNIISNTICSDQTSRFSYKKWKHNCHELYYDHIIDNIVKQQKQKLEDDAEDTSYAVILDDLCGQFPKVGGARKGMGAINLATRFRHYVRQPDPCLLLFSTQKYFDLHPIVRVNITSCFISGNVRNRKEIDQLVYDFADSFGGTANFLKLLKTVQDAGQYQWLMLKMDHTPPEAWHNLDTQLF